MKLLMSAFIALNVWLYRVSGGRTESHRGGVRPSDWTVSCGGFDSLPAVVILELRGA
jgi:hypothetical protein